MRDWVLALETKSQSQTELLPSSPNAYKEAVSGFVLLPEA
jgi:hypothetical protein